MVLIQVVVNQQIDYSGNNERGGDGPYPSDNDTFGGIPMYRLHAAGESNANY